MSKIHKPAIERLKASGTDGEGLMQIMDEMIRMSEEFEQADMTTLVSYIEAEDEFVEGTWVPELWIVVRKVLPDETEQTASPQSQTYETVDENSEVGHKSKEQAGD